MDILHFLNLQYWYCTVYSLFGGRCTYLEELRAAEPAQAAGPGFFERLIDTLAASWGAVWGVLSGLIAILWSAYGALAWAVSGFLFFSIALTLALLMLLRLREEAVYGTLPLRTEVDMKMRDYWNELLEGALSSEPTLWRESILAADRMLGDLLELIGIPGATTPDRMRALPEDAFLTVPQAWEAHRVRNFVSSAHSDFILTQREAFRVMKLYEQVFEEHRYI